MQLVEPTSLHCAVVPVDFDWAGGRPILDDEISAIIERVPLGAEFIYVSDSCYSGELTRVTRWGRARATPAPPKVAQQIALAKAVGMTPQSLTVHDRCALISGCRANQTAEDDYFDSGFHGALTYHLYAALNEQQWASAPLSDLLAEVGLRLKAGGYTQEPQLHGPASLLQRSFLAS